MRRLAAAALIVAAACASVPAPRMRVARRAELPHDAAVIMSVEDGTPSAAVGATRRSLERAGLRVVPRLADSVRYIARLSAKCGSRWRGWRCHSYSVRVVNRRTTEIVASAALDPMVRQAPKLSSIADTLTLGLKPR